MTSTSKTSSWDEHWIRMLTRALIYQQDFYELLPDWIAYKKDDIKYLKQNIGYAIFGPPLFEKNSNSNDILNYNKDNITDDTKISDLVCYGPSANEIINLIVDQICAHGSIPGHDIIHCSTIYLIVINNDSSVQFDENKEEVIAMPLFKILKYNGNNDVLTQKSNDNKNMYATWYIDIKGRIYKGWEDFMTTNDLPKCTIVYPKDGYYQPDPAFNITPNRSIVRVIAKDSIACSQRAKILSKINTTVDIVTAGASIGLAIAACFTPAGPLLTAAGLATMSASSVWTIGKCSANLYDRAVHEESISLLNRSALSSWLGIAGCTIGIAVSGGSILLRGAAISGTNVGTFAKSAYNGILIGSISINLIGLTYQGVNIYKKYQENGTVDMQDVVYLGTHLLFFTSNIIDIKFANDIIETTQGQVLKEFEANLRDDNLRKHYNYIQGKAAATSATKIEQNAAVIRHINKFCTSNISKMPSVNNNFQSSNNVLTVQHCALKVNGITLIDPISFVADFAKSYLRQITKPSRDRSNSPSVDQSNMLTRVLENLLGDLYTSKDCPTNEHLLIIPDFKVIIDELKNVKRAEDILSFLFNNAFILVKALNNYAYLVEGCRFIWDYVKMNMQEVGVTIYSNFDNGDTNSYNASIRHIRTFFIALFDAIDSSVNRFLNALHQYINLCGRQIVSNSKV